MIVAGVVNSFKLEILQGVHQPDDVYRLALYVGTAMLTADTTAYQTAGEVNGSPGYTPGGQMLTGITYGLADGIAFVDWDDAIWPVATITARAALIYNFTKKNRAVAVLDLGGDYTSTNGPFVVALPAPAIDQSWADVALIRIG